MSASDVKPAPERSSWPNPANISPEFSKLLVAQILSTLGEFLLESALLIWATVALLEEGFDVTAIVGLVLAAAAIPRVFVAPFAGVVSDRHDWRAVMLLADISRLILALLIYLSLMLVKDPGHQLVAVVTGVFLFSSAGQLFVPARASAAQLAIPADKRPEAASLSMFSVTGVGIIAAMGGPTLYALIGLGPTTVIVAGCFVLSTVAILHTSRRPEWDQKERTGFFRSIWEGWKLCWVTIELRVLIVGVSIYGLALGISNQTLSLFSIYSVGSTPQQFGLITGAFAIGGLLGSIFAARVIRLLGDSKSFVAGIILLGLTYACFSLAQTWQVAAVAMLLCGMSFSLYSSAQGPTLQRIVPPGLMGRVVSTMYPTMNITSIIGLTFSASVVASLVQNPLELFGRPYFEDPYRVSFLLCALLLVIGGTAIYAASKERSTTAKER